MEREEFFAEVLKNVKERVGEEYQVSLKKITKNNHVILNGLMIGKKDVNIAPTIYIDSFWQSYRWGMSLNAIIDKIMEVFQRESPKKDINMDFFKKFESVKSKICYKLVNYAENKELLRNIPHVKFLDLAVCFYYAYYGEQIGKGSILIYNTHMELWKTNTQELMELASENTPKLFPEEFCSMEDILTGLNADADGEFGGTAPETEEVSEIPMYVLTNSARIFGAAVILYDGVLRAIAEKMQCDLLIIPSSVHEVILLKKDDSAEGETIKKMIHEVNETQVEPEERLSESLYQYRRKEGEIHIFS